jgi:hypothetical protein
MLAAMRRMACSEPEQGSRPGTVVPLGFQVVQERGASCVDVLALVSRVQPVIGGVVQAPAADGGPVVIRLGGVVEHHVEQHLEPGGVQGVDHGLELGDLAAGSPGPAGGRVSPDAGRSNRSCWPHFEFTDPPFRHSLPMTLAFAATASRPTAVLTGPLHLTGAHATPIRRQPAADLYDMARAGIEGRPLTATAVLAWSGDLPRELQQVLFDTADHSTYDEPPAAAS